MILLMGVPSEPPLRLLAEACRKKRKPFGFFNQRKQQDWAVAVCHQTIDDSRLHNGEKEYRLGDCSGLYLRAMDGTKVPEYKTAENKEDINRMYHRLFRLLDAETACRITNAPAVQMSNNSKPYQSIIIQQHGLDIPDMCITSNEDEARAFLYKHKAAIYKSISGSRSIVKQTDASSLKQLSRIRYCPVQFQEFVQGYNVRVHVVGTQAIATRIISNAVDYRYAHEENRETTLKPFALSDELSEKCIRLAHGLNLPFAGIDLMFANDGRIVCFEVNPSPGYSYYESATGQQISYALADYLSHGMN